MEEYEEARILAKKALNPSAAVSATNGKVKLWGLEAPVKSKVDHSSEDGSMTPTVITRTIIDPSNDGGA